MRNRQNSRFSGFSRVLLLSIVFLVVFYSTTAYASTTCTMDDCKITITLKIAFSGADQAYMDRVEDEIEDVWNGPNGFRTTGDCECVVKFDVQTMKITNASQVNCNPGPPGYHCIMVTPYAINPPKDTNGTTYAGYMYPPGITTGQSINGWWSDKMSTQVPGTNSNYTDFAHEAGHMMGFDDDYNKSRNYYGKNLMGQTWPPHNTLNQTMIDTAVSNVCGPNPCPDYCCCGNGEIEKGKGEECDPFAEPNGCESGKYCCPICCHCYEPMCIQENGEYADESACDNACTDGKCYYNYQTGCWDCLKQKPVETPSSYDTTVKQVEGIFDEHSDEHEPILPPESEPKTVEGYNEVYEPVLKLRAEMEEELTEEEQEEVVEEIIPTQEAYLFDYIEQMNYGMLEHPLLSSLFADERIDIYIGDISSEPYAYIITKNGKIIDIGEGPVKNPTINIHTNSDTVFSIMEGRSVLNLHYKRIR